MVATSFKKTSKISKGRVFAMRCQESGSLCQQHHVSLVYSIRLLAFMERQQQHVPLGHSIVAAFMACPTCSLCMASRHGQTQVLLPCGMSQFLWPYIVCMCGHVYRHKLGHQQHPRLPAPFLSHGALHWAASAMGSTGFGLLCGDSSMARGPWLPLCHTWIGLFHGFQEEKDPKNWEVLNQLGKFPSGPRQPIPQKATSSLVAPWDPRSLAAVPEVAPEDEVEPCWNYHRFLCFTQTPNDTSQDVLWKKRFQVYHKWKMFFHSSKQWYIFCIPLSVPFFENEYQSYI